MKTDKPRVSIGLPVFNGEDYLSEAIDSILGQTFENFELIILNNASTDTTHSICKTYAARDPRIRYFRNDVNLGASWNFNRVFELATGEYFKWAAHDDICTPEFLEQCVKVLDSDPCLIVCHPRTRIIDKRGKASFNYVVQLNLNQVKRYERFREMAGTEHWCYQVFGLIRTNILKKTALIGSYSDSDRVLLAELSLWGPICEIPGFYFLRRDHPRTSTRMHVTNLERMVWFEPNRSSQFYTPGWLKFKGYLAAINRVPMSRPERLLCLIQVFSIVAEKTYLRLFRKFIREDRNQFTIPIEEVD